LKYEYSKLTLLKFEYLITKVDENQELQVKFFLNNNKI
jgi:hypothetical protein